MFTLPNLQARVVALAAHVPGPSQLHLRVAFGDFAKNQDVSALLRAVKSYFLTEPSDARIALVQRWVNEAAPACADAVALDAAQARYARSRQSGNGYGGV